ncbi:phosphatidylinositol N-acetylglucosaminyltransferase subunit C-like [Daphnia pulicaria]|jgi:phosphatidylinositol glycan class C protein|uniref:phosphatidylinositol N-acetylglucosaminyltransferase subunit C-like n=1 Tax=Daphnia pulicaria TaxID=35523 RepID=UPI001EEA551B|nr:phosphatidylinositol N-acetylglucosaminyltransferase subunit C-like [Daphnia pulicaria]
MGEHVTPLEDKWEKVLFKKSSFPDNYTDPKFLDEIKRNVHFKPIDTRTALLKSTRISTQISVTVIFWAVFLQLKDGSAIWEVTYGIFSFIIIAAYVVSFRFNNILPVLKNVFLFIAVGYGCTPVLKTLTDTISTDSIYAMSVVLMLVHIAFHQYGMDGVCVSPYVSLNAAICGAICLASRLQETRHAFALLTLAVQAFALFPKLYEVLNYTLIAFIILTAGAFCCMISISLVSAILFLLSIFCVNLIFPLCFVWAQQYKNNIYGPWDEAMIFNR